MSKQCRFTERFLRPVTHKPIQKIVLPELAHRVEKGGAQSRNDTYNDAKDQQAADRTDVERGDKPQYESLNWVHRMCSALGYSPEEGNHASYRAAIGILRPLPNALEVTFSPGAVCLLLYSFLRTASSTQATVSRSNPLSIMRSNDRCRSM